MKQYVKAFHGTSQQNAISIKQNGFKIGRSQGLMLGDGIYFTEHMEKASHYGDVIIVCELRMGKVKEITYDGQYQQKTWQNDGYDSAYVPENTKFSKFGYSEICVKSPYQIEIIGMAKVEVLCLMILIPSKEELQKMLNMLNKLKNAIENKTLYN